MFEWGTRDTVGCVCLIVATLFVAFFLGFVVRGC